ncbi:hypothetical protein AB0N64_14545 [Microbacterium sp. NPDC089318]
MRKHLRDVARNALNDLHLAGRPVPTVDALADALAAYVWDECEHLVHIQAPGEPRRTGRERDRMLNGAEAVERVARNAAAYRLDRWSPDYIAEMQRLGGIGGQRSRRGPTWTDADLDALAALDGLTVDEQAVRLDMRPSMIKRMRRALADRDAKTERVT